MRQIHATAFLALSALAVPASTALAQTIFGPGMQGVAPRANQGGVHEKDVPTCQASGGGSRMKANCDLEPSTAREEAALRTERELRISIGPRPMPTAQCGATTTTEYEQRNTIARVNGTLEIADCAAASGALRIALRVRGENGEIKPLEFSETFERNDDQHVKFTAEYPIGENAELISVRVRDVDCTCTDAASED